MLLALRSCFTRLRCVDVSPRTAAIPTVTFAIIPADRPAIDLRKRALFSDCYLDMTHTCANLIVCLRGGGHLDDLCRT